jgi:hypothetical protein
VSNVYRSLEILGWQDAEPALRFCATKCCRHPSDLDRANAGRSRRSIGKVPPDWASSRSDKGAVLDLIVMFREGMAADACESTCRQLLSGKLHAGAVWDAVFLTTNELSARFKWGGLCASGRPRHSITGTNALHCDFRTHSDPEVRLFVLLQAVAMTCNFLAIPRDDGHLNDFKFPVAALENYQYLSPQWRPNFLAASVFLLHGTQMEDNSAVQEARETLRSL